MDFKERCRPKLKLFLSVDVMGSTAFKKQKSGTNDIQPWLPFFSGFYTQFPTMLERCCRKKGLRGRPQLWKALGDEMVFVVELKSYTDAIDHVSAFRNAVREYSDRMAGKKLSIKLKAAAWLAGFPVGNAEFALDNSDSLDYIGPLVDIGFRLAKLSDSRRFMISVDLALLLLEKNEDLKYFYDGQQVLKGVLDDKPYPLIWIDMLNKAKNENALRGADCPPTDLKKYCGKFIKDVGKPLMRPFIAGDVEFGEKPERYDQDLATVISLLRDQDVPAVDEQEQKESKKKSPSTNSEKYLLDKIKRIPKN